MRGGAGAHEMSWTFPFSRAVVIFFVNWGPFRQFSPSSLPLPPSPTLSVSLPPLESHVSLTRISASSLGETSSISARMREKETETDQIEHVRVGIHARVCPRGSSSHRKYLLRRYKVFQEGWMPSDERTGPLFSASDTTTTDLIVGGGVRRDRDADGMTDTDS